MNSKKSVRELKTVDTRGMVCPLPISIISRNVKALEKEDTVRVLADDKGIKHELEIWAEDTGNELLSFEKTNGWVTAVVKRGPLFHGKGIRGHVDFYMLGVRVHVNRFFAHIFGKMPRFLITFVSVTAGRKSIRYLKQNSPAELDSDHEKPYRFKLLPVPDEIYPHCGLVLGLDSLEQSARVYHFLRRANYAVEDLYRVDGPKNYCRIPVPQNV